MATKAELEKEVAELRSKLSEQESEPEAEQAETETPGAFADILHDHGVDADQIEAIWAQFSKELGDIPQEKPILTAIAAFGIGFALGRLTKT